MDIQKISIEELKRRLDAHESVALLDTRAPEAWEKADVKLPAALRVPPDEVDKHLSEIPRDRLVVTYCT